MIKVKHPPFTSTYIWCVCVCEVLKNNTTMRSSILVIKSNAQNQMAQFGFGHKFRDLKCIPLMPIQACMQKIQVIAIKYLTLLMLNKRKLENHQPPILLT